MQVASGGPSAREGHKMAYDAVTGRTLLFGGTAGGSTLGDTWDWDGTTWTLRAMTGPSPRVGHGMVSDRARNRVVVFGGNARYSNPFGGTWEWDGSSWTQVASTGPEGRTYFGMAYDVRIGRTVVYGGGYRGSWPYYGSYYRDTWVWDGSSWAVEVGTGPAPRYAGSMAFDGVQEQTLLFGGYDGYFGFGDTWWWDGRRWDQADSGGPLPRYGAGMCYDTRRRRVVLFGGTLTQTDITKRGVAGDTWEWDGTMWIYRSSTGPSPQANPTMAFDKVRGCTVLFGAGTQSTSETWEWDGTIWTLRTTMGPATTPSTSHPMVFDEARGRVVMVNPTSDSAGQGMWDWDGVSWMRVTRYVPSGVTGALLANDQGRQRIVAVSPSETWEWDGVTWSRTSVGIPDSRYGFSLAYDDTRHRVVLFGGISNQRFLNDAWEYGYFPPSEETVSALIDAILGRGPSASGMDSNGDGAVDASDLVRLFGP